MLCNASGQKNNLEKTSVCFARGVPPHKLGLISYSLGIKEVSSHDRCIGLPNHVGQFTMPYFVFQGPNSHLIKAMDGKPDFMCR